MKDNKEFKRCEPCNNCPICYKKTKNSNEDFIMIIGFLIFIIILFAIMNILGIN